MKRFPALLALLLVASPLLAQSPADEDPYAKARELIADIGRIVAPNGVQESLVVTLGGARQAISVRGVDRENPILLFIHGGPGSVEMPIAWTFQRPWEDFFTVVQWDQRGAGKSCALNDPQSLVATMEPECYRDDAIELIEFLRERYGKRKVFLQGHSRGAQSASWLRPNGSVRSQRTASMRASASARRDFRRSTLRRISRD